ncbi:hypothetical protein [Nostoc sp. CCY0012]|uniref:hypothetical protein n=1 Tax=Nostoc sp. CCY0012 TaxID=1056123 RepID=UPI0039C60969
MSLEEKLPRIIEPNPYEVLDIAPDATNAVINQAFARAMKQRKYPPDIIAKARKSLLNTQERIIADYLRPILPDDINDFQREHFADMEVTEIILEFLPEFDNLQAAISNDEDISAIDRSVGLTLTEFFKN